MRKTKLSKKGYTFSEEHKKKLSLAKLGKPRAGNPKKWKHSEKLILMEGK